MSQNFKNKFLAFSLFLAIVGFFPMVTHAANPCDQLKSTLNFGGAQTGKNLSDGLPQICTLGSAISIGINLLLGLAGGVAVLFIVIGGFWYMTSAGNAEQAEKGTKTLQTSIIGLVIVILSAVIVRLVLNTLMNSAVNNAGTPTSSSSTPPASSGGNLDPVSTFSSSLIIPSGVLPAGPLRISAVFDSSVTSQLQQLAGGGSPTLCDFTVVFNGQTQASKIVADASGKYLAETSVAGPFTPGASLPVQVFICSTQVANKQITVAGP